MTNQTKESNILDDMQDLVIVRRSGKDSYVYAVKPSLSFQRKTYDESISNPEDKGIPAFDNYWKFDDKIGIRGSSSFLALRYDKRSLRPRGLWLPGLLEAKVLENEGKLENGVYRDYDMVAYSEGNPNKQVAQTLIPQAKKLGLDLPLVLPFMVLDYSANKEVEHGANISLVENPRGVISGDEAENTLNSLNHRGNSGVRRLVRYGDGGWVADWGGGGLVDSSVYGRVDWICGEATQKTLSDAYSSLSQRKFGDRIKELQQEQEADVSRFQESLKQ